MNKPIGIPKGISISDETKLKMSIAHKGKKQNLEWIKKRIENKLKTHPHLSEETKIKIGKASKERIAKNGHPMLGKHISDVTKKKISISHTGLKISKLAIEKRLETLRLKGCYHHSEETKRKISIARKGKRHTEESKNKIRQCKLGKKASEETKHKQSLVRKGKVTWLKGLTKETNSSVAKISESKKGKKLNRPQWNTGLTKDTHPGLAKMSITKLEQNAGSKNPNWKGGLSFLPYNPTFNAKLKQIIRERDKFTCQYPECNLKETKNKHDVHHIDYIKENNSFNNLITLCHRHNDIVNGNREHWKQYFKNIVTKEVNLE